MDDDPVQAIAEARALRASGNLSEHEAASLRAAILVDAGNDLRDGAAITEGADLFRTLIQQFSDRLDLQYNLANALASRSQCHTPQGWQWYQDTVTDRREARRLYGIVAHAADSRLASRAWANLGNLYLQSFRLIEAHDAYMASVEQDSTNAIAWSGAAKVLRTLASWRVGPPRHLNETAEGYLVRAAAGAKDRGPGARRVRAEIERMGANRRVAPKRPDLRSSDPYVQWVGENRLALSPTIVGLPVDIARWDTLTIPSVTEGVASADGVPPVFAMFNTMKADYLTARWLTHRALFQPPEETGYYADTLDYANYGVTSSALALSHRAAVDILDRIAVAASEYFGLPGSVREIYFWSRWHVTERRALVIPLRLHEAVFHHVATGNLGVLALSEMAEDLASGGALEGQRLLRHVGTHRFVVLHDMMVRARESIYVERWSESAFRGMTVEALQTVRAALFYLIQAITVAERQRESSIPGIILPLEVPPHHWIRGEESQP